ncbi:MAG: DUF368 domain-containing protein, partial [Bacteroidetes bacterium]|nr:DUF368 domain-containing protein [Bacteroidota bacterium]
PTFKAFISDGLKGFAMGAANVIPGVSGGTIAVVTGIYEKLLNAVKSIDLEAARLLIRGDFKGFSDHINFFFLLSIGIGAMLSLVSLALLFKILLVNHAIYLWSFFFGLILGSVYFLTRTISKVSTGNIAFFVVGTAVAVGISLLKPGAENDATWYLLLCGVVAICSMILPGLSGSYVLILMGNYQLIMINAVSTFNLSIITPVGIGCVAGVLAFSRILSWLFDKFKDFTISLLSGFILGSLLILWPWKEEIIVRFADKPKVAGYEWYIPSSFDLEVASCVGLMIIGCATIFLMEKISNPK